MTPADLDALGIGRNQRGGNAVLVLVADQVVGVVQLERQSEHRRDGCERDVALAPVEPDAGNGLALPFAFANDTGVDQ